MPKHMYRVWSAILTDDDDFDIDEDAAIVEAESPQQAAELYVEDDAEGHALHWYGDRDGSLVHVRDPEGVVWEVRVAVEYAPITKTIDSGVRRD